MQQPSDDPQHQRLMELLTAIQFLRGSMRGMGAEIRELTQERDALKIEVEELRRENTELRFNWIAAAEGDVLP